MESVPAANPVDAIGAIPDIVGDSSMELVVGERDGYVVCLSGGHSPTFGIPVHMNPGQSGISVYPNPCTDVLNIVVDLKSSSFVRISVTDITGKIVFTRNDECRNAGMQEYRIKREQVGRPGLYLVSVQTKEGEKHFKVTFN